MKLVNAGGSGITAYIARFALIGTHRKPLSVVMHPVQLMMAENAAIACVDIVEICQVDIDPNDPEKSIDLLRHVPPHTFAGIPLVEDLKFPKDEIEFRDSDGAIVRIKNLAVPPGL